MLRAEEVGTQLRALEAQLQPDAQVVRIDSQLPAMSERLTERFERTRQTIAANPGLASLGPLTESWQSSRLTLGTWLDVLTARAIWLDQQRQQLAALDKTWGLTRQTYAVTGPEQLLKRIDLVRSSLAAAQKQIETQRAATLKMQDGVAREVARCEEALALLDQAHRRATSKLFVRESTPIWSPEVRRRALSELPGLIGPEIETQRELLRRFVQDQIGPIALHGGLILGLALFIWRGRRRAREWTIPGRPAASLAAVFEQPLASALVLGLPLGLWLYADEPPTVRVLAQIGMLFPAVVILRRLVPPAVRPGLYGLAAFYLVDRLRDALMILPLLERVLFVAEMLAAVAALGWVLWSGRIRDFLAGAEGALLARGWMLIARLAFVGVLAAFVAEAIGNTSLARLLGRATLASGYLALVLVAGRRLMEGVLAFALRVRPLRLLRTVEGYRTLLEQRAHVGLRLVAVTIWALTTLDYFGLLAPTFASGRRMLTAKLTHGALQISVGDVLAFVLTIYAAFLVSGLLRLVLEQDVFPRLRLRAGLPYALSSVLRYAIIFVGFILALLALGLNLDRVTVLGGAFAVGVGFGLQNVVNNFVSGLIVLFERPVRVGDAVQVGDVQGEVRRIGIRSSTVRSWEGAEVVVPNSMLVADKVTNWTPADQCRRFDVRVGVAYGTAPDQVLKVLAEVAHGHPDVLAVPPPLPLFLGFGDSALLFELRVWTDRPDRYVTLKSDVGVAVYAALREAGMTIPLPQQEVRVHQ